MFSAWAIPSEISLLLVEVLPSSLLSVTNLVKVFTDFKALSTFLLFLVSVLVTSILLEYLASVTSIAPDLIAFSYFFWVLFKASALVSPAFTLTILLLPATAWLCSLIKSSVNALLLPSTRSLKISFSFSESSTLVPLDYSVLSKSSTS